MNLLFTLGGQSIRATASVLPVHIQSWFPLGLTGLISFLYKGLSRVFPNTTVQKHQFFGAQPSSQSFTISWSLLKLMSIELMMPSNYLILCCPLLLLPSVFPSTRVFSDESALCIRWPKYWSFSFNISPSSEYPGLISFRMYWLDLLAVQRILKNLPPIPQFKRVHFFSAQLSL